MRHVALICSIILWGLSLGLGAAGVWAQDTGGTTAPAVTAPLLPAGLQWSTDAELALAAARAAGRPIYVYIWARYNPDCVKMADETLAYDQVVAQLASLQLVALDAHTHANFAFFDKYKIPYFRVEGPNGEEVPPGVAVSGGAGRYPTHLFLDAQGREVYRMYGFVEGKGFAVRLGQVTEILKARENLDADPDSPSAELRVGHLYMQMVVLTEARNHLERALQLDPQNRAGVVPDARLDLTIIGIPDDPAKSVPTLQQWQKENAAHPRRLEALYYEAAANVAAAEALMAAAPEGTTGLTKEANARLDAAVRLLLVFKQSKPGSPEHESQWYLPAMALITGIDVARQPPPKLP